MGVKGVVVIYVELGIFVCTFYSLFVPSLALFLQRTSE